MARFRYSGTNWEGRRWRAAGGIVALGSQIEAAWPTGAVPDGTVASRPHDQTNPRSDHRPYPYTGAGVVFALDMAEVIEGRGAELAEALRESRDPRLRYVIHESRLFSSYDHTNGPAWSWRPYRGGNEHLNHVHVSLWRDGGDSSTPFDIDLGSSDVELIKNLQTALNAAGAKDKNGAALKVDGVWGPLTESAFINGLRLGGGGISETRVKQIIGGAKITA